MHILKWDFHHFHYSPIHLVIGILLLMLVMRFFRIRRQQATKNPTPSKEFFSHEVAMIAGDNLIATQLDLARAYIEMDKKHMAKNILFQIKKTGTDSQKTEANKLLETI